MFSLNAKIKEQYDQIGLYEVICIKLEQKGVDLKNVSRTDISGVDEFHVRGSEVSNELAKEIYLADTQVLDLGCGLGGPARMLADRHNCKVTGVDLNEEYIKTARQLSDLTGLSDKTTFIHADAMNLPFEDSSFDVVWTQHVQMNIEDKATFYNEINRVLKDEGALVYYDIFQQGNGPINYPVPWADSPAISFLETTSIVNHILTELGFVELQTTNQTYKAKQFLTRAHIKLKKDGPSILGLDLLMGKLTIKKLKNILVGIEENKIELQSGIYRKQSDFKTENNI